VFLDGGRGVIAVVLLCALGLLMHAVRSFAAAPEVGDASAAALAYGFLLLAAYLAGGLFARARLPRLTGYLVTGVIVGPKALGLLSPSMVADLAPCSGVAVALIALAAGAEIELAALRPLARSIAWLTAVAVLGTMLLLALVVGCAGGLLPLPALSSTERLAVAAVLGVALVAQSPAVVVALRDELGADGPLARTVLAVVVLSDLVVILLFAVVSSLAQAAFGARADVAATAARLAWELLGSIAAGVGIGALVAVYLARVGRSSSLLVVTACFVVAEVGMRVHFDPLLVALAAGAFVRNATRAGERLLDEISLASLPVQVAFFAIAGAGLHLDLLPSVGAAATVLAAVRALGFQVGGRLAARAAGAPKVVRRGVGFGLMPQAGLALALALLVDRTLPVVGAEVAAVTFSVVAINELVAPVLYRFALVRAGEAGARRRAASDERA
jgi:Kef-type K+ transport system membrane component KefB